MDSLKSNDAYRNCQDGKQGIMNPGMANPEQKAFKWRELGLEWPDVAARER